MTPFPPEQEEGPRLDRTNPEPSRLQDSRRRGGQMAVAFLVAVLVVAVVLIVVL